MAISAETVKAVEDAYKVIPSGTSQVISIPDVDQLELLEVFKGLHLKVPSIFASPDFCYDGQANMLVHKP